MVTALALHLLSPLQRTQNVPPFHAAESHELVSFFLMESFLFILTWHGMGHWGPLQTPVLPLPLSGPGPAPQAVIFVPRMPRSWGFRRSVWSATETWRNGRFFPSTWFNAKWQVRLLDDLTHLEFQPICPSPPLSLPWCEPVTSLPPSTRAKILTFPYLTRSSVSELDGAFRVVWLTPRQPADEERFWHFCFNAGHLRV